MKKTLLITTACIFSAPLQTTHLLQDFETVKSTAVRDIHETEQKIKKDWDIVIDYLEKSLSYAKTLKTTNANINQHDHAAQAIKENLEKQITGKEKGKTKAKLSDYKNTAHDANTKTHQHLQRATHLSQKLEEHLSNSTTCAKDDHKEVVAAHDSAQKAIAQADAIDHMPENMHQKHKKHDQDNK